MTETKPKRGFAAMDLEKRRAIAARGGAGVRPEDRSFSKSRELAAAAGRVGGKRVDPKKRSFSTNRDLAVAAGREGGKQAQRIKGYTAVELKGDKLIEAKIIDIDPARCPHCILLPGHYRADGTCLCNDPNATVMAEWGYVWKNGQWR